jgi:putative transposase
VQDDEHFLTVCRYVERNALRADLVRKAEDWPWCSLHRRGRRSSSSTRCAWLGGWPLKRPAGWTRRLNTAETEAGLTALRQSISRGRPFGDPAWTEQAAERLGLEMTLRPHGRPKKTEIGS